MAQIMHELRRKHPDAAGGSDLSDFELTLALLPDHSVWRVADLTPAVVALAPGDRLFTIALGSARAAGTSLSTSVVDGDTLLARLEWGENVETGEGQVWRRTRWTFPFPGQDDEELEEWQRANGSVRTDVRPLELDHDERYARALFARIAHPRASAGGGFSAFDERESFEEPPPLPGTSARHQVTDIWGNPIDRRRGRRR